MLGGSILACDVDFFFDLKIEMPQWLPTGSKRCHVVYLALDKEEMYHVRLVYYVFLMITNDALVTLTFGKKTV